jgi:hypothetical protein
MVVSKIDRRDNFRVARHPTRIDAKCGSLPASRLQGSDSLTLFSLEGVEIVVFAFILVLLRDRYTNGSEQLPVLLGP